MTATEEDRVFVQRQPFAVREVNCFVVVEFSGLAIVVALIMVCSDSNIAGGLGPRAGSYPLLEPMRGVGSMLL